MENSPSQMKESIKFDKVDTRIIVDEFTHKKIYIWNLDFTLARWVACQLNEKYHSDTGMESL